MVLQVRQVLSYERDRVRFLLKAYLRARLEKVQRFAGRWLCWLSCGGSRGTPGSCGAVDPTWEHNPAVL